MRLWDVETGKELRTFEGHASLITSVDLSPDGKKAVSASGDRTVRLWDVDSGAEVQRFVGHTSLVWSVAFSTEGWTLTTLREKRLQVGAKVVSHAKGIVFQRGPLPSGLRCAGPVRRRNNGGASCAVAQAATGRVVAMFFGGKILATVTLRG
jgi:hypothetical protein